MGDEYVLDPHLSSDWPVGARRNAASDDAVVCL